MADSDSTPRLDPPRAPRTKRNRHGYRRIAKGIYQHGRSGAYRVMWRTAAGKLHEKAFPMGTPWDFVLAFHQQQILQRVQDHQYKRFSTQWSTPLRMEDNRFCYIYFVRSSGGIKIGRAIDVKERLRDLQTNHPEPLELLTAIPAHAAIERAIHEHFAGLRQTGEWFHPHEELMAFINQVHKGYNPVAALLGLLPENL